MMHGKKIPIRCSRRFGRLRSGRQGMVMKNWRKMLKAAPGDQLKPNQANAKHLQRVVIADERKMMAKAKPDRQEGIIMVQSMRTKKKPRPLKRIAKAIGNDGGDGTVRKAR